MDWKKETMAAAAFLIIAIVVHSAGTFATMDYYADPAYMHVWSDVMMPEGGAPGADFYYHSIAFSFVTGLLFMVVYSHVKPAIHGETDVKRGIHYGFFVFLLAGIPGALSTYLLIRLPVMLIAVWTMENLVIYLLGGIVAAKLL